MKGLAYLRSELIVVTGLAAGLGAAFASSWLSSGGPMLDRLAIHGLVFAAVSFVAGSIRPKMGWRLGALVAAPFIATILISLFFSDSREGALAETLSSLAVVAFASVGGAWQGAKLVGRARADG